MRPIDSDYDRRMATIREAQIDALKSRYGSRITCHVTGRAYIDTMDITDLLKPEASPELVLELVHQELEDEDEDTERWAELAEHHAHDCEWIETRAQRIEVDR